MKAISGFVKGITVSAFLAAALTIGVSAAGAGIVVTESDNLNVRSAPSKTSEIIDSLPRGAYVTLEDGGDGWWYAEYDDDAHGYLYSGYIKTLDAREGTVMTGGEPLNVRSGSGITFPAIDALPDGAKVLLLGVEANGWGVVLYDGNSSGYVDTSFLNFDSPDAEHTYPAISLDTVSYKQYDARWSELYVGRSGHKVKSIGCTLTCVAMAESYRQGNTVTPADIVANSSFTAGGAYYWPQYYEKSYDADYLTALYDKLSEGIPVIFEAKNSSASHWVLVTGYNGGDTLDASGFIINDPGFATRTTLAEHLKAYPNYSKFVYYVN